MFSAIWNVIALAQQELGLRIPCIRNSQDSCSEVRSNGCGVYNHPQDQLRGNESRQSVCSLVHDESLPTRIIDGDTSVNVSERFIFPVLSTSTVDSG
jgi:hypothetical protein